MGCRFRAGRRLCNRVLQAGEDTPGHFITGRSAFTTAALKTQVLRLLLDFKSLTSMAGALWGKNIRLWRTLMLTEHEAPCVTCGWDSDHTTRLQFENSLQKQKFQDFGAWPVLLKGQRGCWWVTANSCSRTCYMAPIQLWTSTFGTLQRVEGTGGQAVTYWGPREVLGAPRNSPRIPQLQLE